jgi:hypothetical protein
MNFEYARQGIHAIFLLGLRYRYYTIFEISAEEKVGKKEGKEGKKGRGKRERTTRGERGKGQRGRTQSRIDFGK